jgi:RNA polymerase sigma factor (sigma-70 family)
MVENDYAVLAKFEGRSSLQSYLTVVVQRAFLDFRTKGWGKWRPSAEARRSGGIGVLLERLLVRDCLTFEEACEALKTNHQVTMPRDALERLAARLPARSRRHPDENAVLDSLPASGRSVEEIVTDRDRQAAAERAITIVHEAISAFEAQDRLTLAMRFDDGRTVPEIAAALQTDQKALYRRIDKLLRDLRRSLEQAGIDAATATDILGSPGVDLELSAAAIEEKTPSSPSIGKRA